MQAVDRKSWFNLYVLCSELSFNYIMKVNIYLIEQLWATGTKETLTVEQPIQPAGTSGMDKISTVEPAAQQGVENNYDKLSDVSASGKVSMSMWAHLFNDFLKSKI